MFAARGLPCIRSTVGNSQLFKNRVTLLKAYFLTCEWQGHFFVVVMFKLSVKQQPLHLIKRYDNQHI